MTVFKKWAGRTTLYAAITAISIVMAFPFVWMFSSSLKTNDEIWAVPPVLWPAEPLWRNFVDAWNAAPFGLYLFNSIFVAAAIVAIQLINSSMMAYALSHMRFALAKPLMGLIIVSYMLPVSATYLSGYVILAKLQLLDTYAGLIVSNAISIFGIFLLRQAYLQIPREVTEAAKIDGAGHWQILWKMMIPLSAPTLIVMSLLTFISQYNNYLWPSLITKNPDLHLVSAGLRSFFVEGGAYGMKWPLIMAGSSFTILPLLILFAVAQKWIIKGVNNVQSVNK
ncbi:carbohydrate ABC transporter permease [Cohnella hongkongensis]|uniref:Carbohydrate ABC transporter permease n=1 Tax=Cohnella hongkongensis TaxID=178337 RepID=A0ABV9FAB9_9BACL